MDKGLKIASIITTWYLVLSITVSLAGYTGADKPVDCYHLAVLLIFTIGFFIACWHLPETREGR